MSAHERLHVHNVRDFPQAKLDSEINPRFLLNEYGDLYLLHNCGVQIILFKLKNKKKNCSEGKNHIAKRVQKTVTRGCEL